MKKQPPMLLRKPPVILFRLTLATLLNQPSVSAA